MRLGFLLVAMLAAACVQNRNVGEFGDAASDGQAAAAGTGGGAMADAGGDIGTGGGSGMGGGGAGGAAGTGGGTAGAGGSGGNRLDANTPDATPDAGHTITCGALSCNAATEVCCSRSTRDQWCAAGPTCAGGAYTRTCDGPSDCGGAPCCGADAPWTATCAPPGATTCLTQFCNANADCPASKPYCCRAFQVTGPEDFDLKACSSTLETGCS